VELDAARRYDFGRLTGEFLAQYFRSIDHLPLDSEISVSVLRCAARKIRESRSEPIPRVNLLFRSRDTAPLGTCSHFSELPTLELALCSVERTSGERASEALSLSLSLSLSRARARAARFPSA